MRGGLVAFALLALVITGALAGVPLREIWWLELVVLVTLLATGLLLTWRFVSADTKPHSPRHGLRVVYYLPDPLINERYAIGALLITEGVEFVRDDTIGERVRLMPKQRQIIELVCDRLERVEDPNTATLRPGMLGIQFEIGDTDGRNVSAEWVRRHLFPQQEG